MIFSKEDTQPAIEKRKKKKIVYGLFLFSYKESFGIEYFLTEMERHGFCLFSCEFRICFILGLT